jgi:alpha-tubulin suppressor-like RCC1 family protein
MLISLFVAFTFARVAAAEYSAACVGDYFACAIRDDRATVCWGRNRYGRLGNGDGNDDIGDGRHGWFDYGFGDDNFVSEMGDALVPIDFGTDDGTVLTAKSIACSEEHACALLSDDTIKCWGRSMYGRLGNGDGNDDIGDDDGEIADMDPVDLGTDDFGTNLTAKSVSAYDGHTCAVLSDDTIKCWGFNNNGQLGQGNTVNIGDGAGEMGDVLVAVDLGTDKDDNKLTAKSVSAGDRHTCAVLSDDTIKCWGYNNNGQLGQGNTDNIGDGAGEMGDFLVAVDLGTDDFGTNLTAKSVSAGYQYTCAVLSDDTIKCWGYNNYGQLGQGNTDNIGDGAGEMGDFLVAVDLGTGLTAKSVKCGEYHTCAILNDDTLKCWGSSYSGQLGEKTTFVGDTTERDDYTFGNQADEMGNYLVRVDLGTGRTVLNVFLQWWGAICAVLDDYSLKCWGGAYRGVLGNEEAAYTSDYVGDGLKTNENGDSVRLSESETEMGDSLVAVNLGTGRTVFGYDVCAANEYVASNACTACPAGTTNAYGNEPSGSDTMCDLCAPDYYVSSNACTACPIGMTNAAGDDATGSDTTCEVTLCTANEYVTSNVCTACPIGTTNAAGDDASGSDTTCDLCAPDYYVSSNACTACPIGMTNAAGDDATGSDTTCGDCASGYYVSSNACTACPGGTTNAAGDDASGSDTICYAKVGYRSTACVGAYFACAIRDDRTTVCWGGDNEGVLGNGNGTDYIGDGNKYSQTDDYVFGDDKFVSEMGDALVPIDFGTVDGTVLTAKSLACGEKHTCAVLSDDTVKCWGESSDGRLGNGDGNDDIGDDDGEIADMDPVDLGTDGNDNALTAKSIDCGKAHTCAVLSDDTVKCWGPGSDGRLGNGNTATIGDDADEMGDNLPAIDLGTDGYGNSLTAKSVACGEQHTCAVLSDDTVKCWGHNNFGQLGQDREKNVIGKMGDALPVVDLGTDEDDNKLTAKSVSAGFQHTCAVLSDDTIKCWGYNANGQLGQGNTDNIGDGAGEMGDALVAVDLGTGLTAKSVKCGPKHTCAILNDDTLKCWGSSYSGQIGEKTTFVGDTTNRDEYTFGNQADEMGDNLVRVDLGNGHTVLDVFLHPKKQGSWVGPTCAVLDDYSLKCWGNSWSGMLGNEEAAYTRDYVGDGLKRNENGDLVRLSEGETEMGDSLIAVNLGTGRMVLQTVFCSDNEYVSSNACTACPAGESNPAGDEQNGVDTTCLCTASSTSSKDGSDGTFYCINGGTAGGTTGSCTCACSAGYEGDNCDTAILCAANQRVVSNACTACPIGTTNAAGDDATGDDTECSALVEEEEEVEPAPPTSPEEVEPAPPTSPEEVEPAPPTSPDANTTEVLEVLTYENSSASRLDISIATIGVVFATILAFATA